MRLDKYLKVSRIIKRRTISKELVSLDRAKIKAVLTAVALSVNIGFVNKYEVPVVKSPCPADGHTKREYIKQLLRKLNLEYYKQYQSYNR